MSDARLVIRHLSKHFSGVYALTDANLEFFPGEVHALLGENGAGKSTLCKMLSGALIPDEGEIEIEGKLFHSFTPQSAKDNGIAMIYQEFNLVPEMMVYENMFLGKEIRRGLDTDRPAMIAKTNEIFNNLGVTIDAKAKISQLSVAYCQLVEIGKAMLEDSKILIMDEPTAALTNNEVDALFELVHKLRAQGITILYISHRISELMELTDRITVMRDGHIIDTLETSKTDQQELIKLMVGRELGSGFPPIDPSTVQDEVLLKVEHLVTPKVHDVSFELRRGEILGLAGLVGAGRSETVRAIFGADTASSGTVTAYGKVFHAKSPADGIKHGIAMIPEDRKREGAHLELPIRSNMSLIKIRDLSNKGFISKLKENALVEKFINLLSIKIPSLDSNVSSLSGGNQQKVVVSKWMSMESDILLFDEPTRGIDVGAKQEIYELMDQLRKQGKGLVMISSEMDEVIGMCNRIIVLYEGHQKAELSGDEITQENIMSYASNIT